MPRRPRPRSPSYIFFDHDRDAWHLRFRYVDSLGCVHWPRERSPWPKDYQRSSRWAPLRREEIIRDLEAELQRLDPPPAVTVGQVLALYEAQCREQGTRLDREAPRLHVIRDTLGAATAVADLTPERVKAWREELRAGRGRRRKGETRRPLSSRSLNAYLTDLKAALSVALDAGLVATNPIARVRALPEPRQTPEALSPRQVAALFRALDQVKAAAPLRGIVLAHYWTGHRTGVILRLRWEQLDLERAVLLIAETKTGRPATVPLDGSFLAWLRERHPGPGAAGWILPNPETGRPYVEVRKPWRRLITAANIHLGAHEQIPAGQRLYSLRHSRISHLLAAGVPPQLVGQMVDNSLRTIDRHYAHQAAEVLRAEVRRASKHSDLRAVEAAASGQTDGQTGREKTGRKLRRPTPKPTTQTTEHGLTN